MISEPELIVAKSMPRLVHDSARMRLAEDVYALALPRLCGLHQSQGRGVLAIAGRRKDEHRRMSLDELVRVLRVAFEEERVRDGAEELGDLVPPLEGLGYEGR